MMRRTIRLTLLALVLVAAPLAFAGRPTTAQPVTCPPPNVYDPVTLTCLHVDPPPPGVDPTELAPPVSDDLLTATSSVCIGSGTDGPRVQVLYARASNVTSRFATYKESIRTWAGNANFNLQQSAGATGGVRTIRFVHDANCVIDVSEAVLTTTGDENFSNTMRDIKALGWNHTDRKYMVFLEHVGWGGCGIGQIYGGQSSKPTGTSIHDGGPLYGVTFNGCWDRGTPLHELLHNLGAVQETAPHGTPNHHCTDEFDRLCYDDDGDGPVVMTNVCVPNSTETEGRLDCNHDDYFHTNPPADNWLATHWNSADSVYLEDNALDTTPPSAVTITSPAASATITATSYSVTATATDAGSTVTAVIFYWCQSLSCTAFGRDLSAPFSATWNTGARANGAYTLKATASDAVGNRKGSATVAVTLAH